MTQIDALQGREALKKGAAAAWPICLGYIPIGLAFGVLVQKIGLSPVQIGLMSLLVFAGSAQFIAVSMLASGASAASIIATTFRQTVLTRSGAFVVDSEGYLAFPGGTLDAPDEDIIPLYLQDLKLLQEKGRNFNRFPYQARKLVQLRWADGLNS